MLNYLNELRKLSEGSGSRSEDDSGDITELERVRKQKDILEALEKVSWS